MMQPTGCCGVLTDGVRTLLPKRLFLKADDVLDDRRFFFNCY